MVKLITFIIGLGWGLKCVTQSTGVTQERHQLHAQQFRFGLQTRIRINEKQNKKPKRASFKNSLCCTAVVQLISSTSQSVQNWLKRRSGFSRNKISNNDGQSLSKAEDQDPMFIIILFYYHYYCSPLTPFVIRDLLNMLWYSPHLAHRSRLVKIWITWKHESHRCLSSGCRWKAQLPVDAE